MRTWLRIVMIFILSLAPFAEHLHAQGPQCFLWTDTEWYGYPAGWIPINPVNNHYCIALWWMAVCALPSPQCAPPDDETQPPCPNCTKPVSLASGNTFIQQNDMTLPGLGGGLQLTRRWNSSWPLNETGRQIGLFGAKWRSTYEEYVFLGYANYMKYSRSDGSFWSFGYSSIGWTPAAPANTLATLIQTSTCWKLTFQNGETRTFDLVTGHLLTISDRNGNTTQLAYDSNNRLTTVTDAVGRSLSFTYGSPSSFLVTGVTASVGSFAVTYNYDTSGRLSQVAYPDQSTVNFGYDSQSLISSVTDSQGRVLESHTYDSNQRGLTSSQANGVNGVTITYPITNASWGGQDYTRYNLAGLSAP